MFILSCIPPVVFGRDAPEDLRYVLGPDTATDQERRLHRAQLDEHLEGELVYLEAKARAAIERLGKAEKSEVAPVIIQPIAAPDGADVGWELV